MILTLIITIGIVAVAVIGIDCYRANRRIKRLHRKINKWTNNKYSNNKNDNGKQQ